MDLDKFGELANQHNKVELALEGAHRAVDVQTFKWLPAGFYEVFDDLWLDFKLLLQGLPEKSHW